MKSSVLLRVLWVLGTLALAGCAKVNDQALRLFATKADVVGIVQGQLMLGQIELIPDRTAVVSLTSDQGPPFQCTGAGRYTASSSGAIDLRCDNSTAVDLNFSLLSETRGFAYGTSTTLPVSLVFGMSHADARAYLMVPAGRTLILRPEEQTLVLQ